MWSAKATRCASLDALFGVAWLLVHRWWGRVAGCALVGLPALVCGALALQQSITLGGVLGYLLMAIPSLLFAFLLHETGHYLALRGMGHRAQFIWRFPLDMRTMAENGGLESSDSPSLLVRGLAGFGVNTLLMTVLVGVAIQRTSPFFAYLALWQGVSALAATAWSLSDPMTDASTLRNALALEDSMELRVYKEGCQTTVLRLAASVKVHWETSMPYWEFVRGLIDPKVAASPGSAVVFSVAPEATMVVFSGRARGTYRLEARGWAQCGQVSCLTRGGSRARIVIYEGVT